MSDRRRTRAVVIAAAAAAVAAVVLSGRCSSPPRRASLPEGDAARTTDSSRSTGRDARSASRRLARHTPDPRVREQRRAGLWMLEDDSISVVLADHVVATRLPPHSRVLLPGQIDLLEPNRRWDSPEPSARADRTFPATEDLRVVFTGDKFRVLGGEPLAAWLEVAQGGEPFPVAIVSARAVGVHIVTRDPVGLEAPLAFRQGVGARHETTFSTRGTPLAGHTGWIHLIVEYDVGEPTPCVAKLEYFHQPEGSEPARFTGVFREELVDGSLWVYAQVEVKRPGYYVFDANFFAGDESPLAFARAKTELGAGTVEVGFQLFGRIVHEQDAHGPFHLRQLRGYRFLAGQDPDRESLAAYPGEHVTKEYARDDFSDAEYWDERKQQEADFHAQQAATSQHGLYKRTLGEVKAQGWQPRP